MADTVEAQKKRIIEELPKPQTVEEQYLYAFACTLAGVEYNNTFKTPFYRKEKIWKAIWQLETMRVVSLITGDMLDSGAVKTANISDKSVSKEKLAEAVYDAVYKDGRINEKALADNSVTKIKLSAEVANKLIHNRSISEEDLTDGLKAKLLQTGNVQEKNLAPEFSAKLLQDGNVTKNNLAAEVLNALLKTGHTGLVKQAYIKPLANTAQLAEVVSKVNELLAALKNSELTEEI